MVKIQHNNFLDSVNDVFTDAKKAGVLYLYADGDQFSGRTISIENKFFFHNRTIGNPVLEQNHYQNKYISDLSKFETHFFLLLFSHLVISSPKMESN